jgi:type III secretion system-like peptide-binding chaperone
MHTWQEAEGEIARGLQELTAAGGDSNFMIISAGDFYVQFSGSRGSSQVHGEAVSNDYLKSKHRLPPEKIDELEKLHFDLVDSPGNFTRDFEVANSDQASDVARLALDILEKIYGCPRTSPIEIELTLE